MCNRILKNLPLIYPILFLSISSGICFVLLYAYEPSYLLIFSGVLAYLFFIVISLKEPFYGICLVIFGVFLGTLAPIPIIGRAPALFYSDIFLFSVLFLFILRRFLYSEDFCQISIPKGALLLLIFVVYASFVLLFSRDPLRGAGTLRNYLCGLIIMLLTIEAIKNDQGVKSIFYAIWLWGTSLAILSIYDVISKGIWTYFWGYIRVCLPLGASNYIAGFFVLVIPILTAILLSRSTSKIEQIALLTSILLMITGLVLTISRGGAVGLLVAFSILAARYFRVRNLSFILIFLGSISILLYLTPFFTTLLQRFVDFHISPSAIIRLTKWHQAWEIFRQYPIFGVGLDNTPFYLLREALFWRIHNLPLMLLSETGIIGFCLFMTLIFYHLKIQMTNYSKIKNSFQSALSLGIFSGTIGVLVHAMVEPLLQGHAFSIMFWCLMGISTKQFLLKEEVKKN